MSRSKNVAASIGEMKEFAGFSAATQRYLRRSLDVAEGNHNVIEIWARDNEEIAQIVAQSRIYSRLPEVRALIPDDSGILSAEPMMSPLVTMAAFDLGQGRIQSFSAFRFLYERMLGGRSRPWLPSAFLAGASMPSIAPSLRADLLRSLTEAAATAAGWTLREPIFIPSWVEKVEA